MAKKITLESLIKAAPLDDQTRKGLLERLPNLTADEKYLVESILWTRIALLYAAQLQKRTSQATLEEIKGLRKLTANDFAEMELTVTREFAQKLESASTEEEVESVRAEIEKYLPKPPGAAFNDKPNG